MKEPVGQRVRLETRDGGRGIAAFAGEQVVPLKDLMEDDAVREAAEPESEQETR